MSSDLSGQTVVIIGGSSGMGYGVAKASLLQHAAHVIIGSSSKEKVDRALNRLKADGVHAAAAGQLTGDVLDARDIDSVKAFFAKLGEIDHLVWTSGDSFQEGKEVFDVRFWGPATAAKAANIRKGGSVTFTTGVALLRPNPGWALITGVTGATDALTRGLAVDLAPIRVNSVCPGLVKTELWDSFPPEVVESFHKQGETFLVKHVADADEIAEAYLFLMKCKFNTGQRIEGRRWAEICMTGNS